MKKKKPEKGKKGKIHEIFEVEKKGKKKIVEAHGTEEKKPITKEQVKSENKILRNFLIGVGVIALVILLVILGLDSMRHFEYRGIKFDVVKEGNIILYKTYLPVIYNGEKVPYNFYLRNDPRKLNVSVENEIDFKENLVINMTQDFNCNGDGIIGIANLLNLYGILGIEVIKDQNASCDAQGRYMFIQIQPGNKTGIEQFGPACYNLNVNNCEILEVTEQLMIETLAKFYEKQE